MGLRLGSRAGRIAGMGLAGMTDMMMLGFVWQSPFGLAAAVRGVGALLILPLRSRMRAAVIPAAFDPVLIAVSYGLAGHAL